MSGGCAASLTIAKVGESPAARMEKTGYIHFMKHGEPVVTPYRQQTGDLEMILLFLQHVPLVYL